MNKYQCNKCLTIFTGIEDTKCPECEGEIELFDTGTNQTIDNSLSIGYKQSADASTTHGNGTDITIHCDEPLCPECNMVAYDKGCKDGAEQERQFILNLLDGQDIADKELGVIGGTKAIRFALSSRIIG